MNKFLSYTNLRELLYCFVKPAYLNPILHAQMAAANALSTQHIIVII